ncbi:MAG: hypothetical protein JST48_10605 [Bacteroidetes bacterium]|nr:hypothetical protein [Bacteroidota bacterium]
MKYSLVNGIKSEAFIQGRGFCPSCEKETEAKCGAKKIHHWAHKSLNHCDNWWENETEWHRNWKSLFPKEWQEVVHFDEITGEKHIADVKTDAGLVIELQNSPISSAELKSRESFYKNLIWVVNGKNFLKNLSLRNKVPSPASSLANDIGFIKGKNPHTAYFFRSEVSSVGVEIHDISEIEDKIELNYEGHHLFDWKRPRTGWFEATCRVFLDFGFQEVYELVTYDPKLNLRALRKISLDFFVKQAQESVVGL